MAAIFAQVHGDAISTRGLTRKRESDAVWFDLIAVIKGVLAITSLPDSRDMIDVDTEKDVSRSHGKKSKAFTCKELIVLLLKKFTLRSNLGTTLRERTTSEAKRIQMDKATRIVGIIVAIDTFHRSDVFIVERDG